MVIPVRRKLVKVHNIATGSRDFQKPVLNGQLPRRMVLAMTGNSAFNGTHNKNPFNFQHFGLTHLAVNYGGKKLEPFNPDFTKEDYIRSYMSLFDGTGAIDKNVALSIRHSEYPEGLPFGALTSLLRKQATSHYPIR